MTSSHREEVGVTSARGEDVGVEHQGGKRVGTARMQVRTSLGDFVITATEVGLRSVTPLGAGVATAVDTVGADEALRHAHVAAAAMGRYAAGQRTRFQGSMDLSASSFHLAVWERLRAIPFGETTTYGEIADVLRIPGEARAVGAAVAANPICILVPCHRVVGADGSLRGFAWGLDLKRRLLAHEGRGALSLFGDGTPV
jgi:methylated-DNA-[protein]-cysteine S-methyltransferase